MMPFRLTRRSLARLLAGTGFLPFVHPGSARSQAAEPAWSYPMGLPGRPLGDGFLIRHGYACENTWFFPGYWHTGEDWYLADGDTAGLDVYAAAAGEIVFAGSDYPGRVVIVEHAGGLYSMYGHLDYGLSVAVGQRVERRQQLGTVLARTDGRAPSHLHFEVRDFLTTPEVNGNAPRYGFNCGVECPPGPGYWPIDAPEHPSAMGWRNPTHVIHRRMWANGTPEGAAVTVTALATGSAPPWSAPAAEEGAAQTAELSLSLGDRYPLLAIAAGAEDATGTSAEAYHLWYQLSLDDGDAAWVRAALPSVNDTGSDGRPSSVELVFLPVMGDG